MNKKVSKTKISNELWVKKSSSHLWSPKKVCVLVNLMNNLTGLWNKSKKKQIEDSGAIAMDVFHIDSSSISSTSLIDPDSEITEVKFETSEHFDLNFFDTPDDSLTQVAFSPNSVESSTSPTPEPAIVQQSSSNVTINQSLPIIKNGKKRLRLARQEITSLCSMHQNCITMLFSFPFGLNSGLRGEFCDHKLW